MEWVKNYNATVNTVTAGFNSL